MISYKEQFSQVSLQRSKAGWPCGIYNRNDYLFYLFLLYILILLSLIFVLYLS